MKAICLFSKLQKEVSITRNKSLSDNLYSSTENAYNETLESVKQSFPQYIRELEGIADGAQVEFHKVIYFSKIRF